MISGISTEMGDR